MARQSTTKLSGNKRRPLTASRKNNQLNFGRKLGSNLVTLSKRNQMPMSVKSVSQISLDMNKLRPKVIIQDRERLYEDIMLQKMTANNL